MSVGLFDDTFSRAKRLRTFIQKSTHYIRPITFDFCVMMVTLWRLLYAFLNVLFGSLLFINVLINLAKPTLINCDVSTTSVHACCAEYVYPTFCHFIRNVKDTHQMLYFMVSRTTSHR